MSHGIHYFAIMLYDACIYIRNKTDFIKKYLIDCKFDIIAIIKILLTDNDTTVSALIVGLAHT